MGEIVDIPHNIVTSSAHAGGDNLPISVVSSDSGISTDTFHYTFLVLFSAHSVLFRVICYNMYVGNYYAEKTGFQIF